MKWIIEVEESLAAVLRHLGAKRGTTPEAVASSLFNAALRSELKRDPRLAFGLDVEALVNAARRRRAQKATGSI